MSDQQLPLHTLIKEHILDMIQTGKYQVDDKLPTEAELCEQFNVSRTTSRLALQQLALEGKVYRVSGKGTFVSKPKVRHNVTAPRLSFFEQMHAQGLQPSNKIIDFQVIPATRFLAETLNVQEMDPVNKITRIRYADNDPLIYETSHIPWKLAPGLTAEDCKESIFQLLLRKYKLPIKRTLESIEPVLVDDYIGKFLNIPAGTPILLIETVTYTDDDLPIEYAHGYYRGDRAKFVVERNFP